MKMLLSQALETIVIAGNFHEEWKAANNFLIQSMQSPEFAEFLTELNDEKNKGKSGIQIAKDLMKKKAS